MADGEDVMLNINGVLFQDAAVGKNIATRCR